MTEEDAATQQPNFARGNADTHRSANLEIAAEDPPAVSTAQEPAPMLEAHAPHKAIHTWTDFFIHIATIVVGLVIAVGLEQTVEFFHHRQQRLELEGQMHEVLEADTQLVQNDLNNLDQYRSYLVDVQKAIVARRHHEVAPPMPSIDDPRGSLSLYAPSLAPYEAAKENGTVVLLSSERIRLFDRLAFQHSSLMEDRSKWNQALDAAGSFRTRFSDARARYGNTIVPDNDLSTISDTDFAEFQALVSALVEETDRLFVRFRRYDAECRAFLGGATTEAALIEANQNIDKDPYNRN